MKRILILIITLVSAVYARAQTVRDLDASFAEARAEFEAIKQEFADSADAALADYLQYEAKLFEEYEKFRDEVKSTWGDSVVVESTRKSWVEYSDDLTSRTYVDWESGKVDVEVLVDPSDDDDTVKAKLEKAVADLLASRGSTNGFNSSVLPDKPISDKPLLDGQINLSKYGITAAPSYEAPKPFENRKSTSPTPSRGGTVNLSRNNTSAVRNTGITMAERVADEQKKAAEAAAALAKAETKEIEVAVEDIPAAVVSAEKPVVETVQTEEGTKTVVKISMELVEDHIPKRAEKFKEMVSAHSATYSVAAPLIYAIMEQESSFNPAAQSWVPAYGLMQLVPKSGGRDAYNYVHKKDEIPSADFLFDPNNNIQLGTGYLKLLMSTSFKKVTDERCKMLCAIAAYNTGAGNVSRAINGTTNISKAIPTINTMTYDQLFEHLKKSLPHAETQDYIQKVTSKMEKYVK